MGIPFTRRTGVVLYAGFMTWLLIFVIGLVVISFVSPALFKEIANAIAKLARAIRGEDVAALIYGL